MFIIYSNFNSVDEPRSADSCWINAKRICGGKTQGSEAKSLPASTFEQTNVTILKSFM